MQYQQIQCNDTTVQNLLNEVYRSYFTEEDVLMFGELLFENGSLTKKILPFKKIEKTSRKPLIGQL